VALPISGSELPGSRVRKSLTNEIAVRRGFRRHRVDTRDAVETVAVGDDHLSGGVPRAGNDGCPALHVGDGAELPAAYRLVHQAAMIEEFLPFPKRQIVEYGGHKAVG